MTILEIFILGLALSADAFAVSLAAGMCSSEVKISDKFKISFFFGIFQGIMPVIGWFAGFLFLSYIKSFDHWIAMGLLSFIGIKMIIESRKAEDCKTFNYFSTGSLFVMAIATSIDALAAGLSILFLGIEIFFPALFIASTTFMISLIGVNIGKKAGRRLGQNAELFGGIILILIGLKILLDGF
ncbi:MAG: manganese efflux pump MntP family protein [Candidatus Delongbacteria bacterium]|nr:manganese efflux pump MntP family protein [Candidatus Delongbacteria bacterium]MCG2761166.1 manganese efflux pump MntP family protein [Candidatus Delongbacteria bacterium]